VRILVIRCGALGDLVYATSIIDALILEYGKDIVIDFVTTPGSGKVFEFDKRINKVFNLKHKKVPIIFSKDKKTIINHSKSKPYDILINLEHGKQFISLVEKIVATKKVGAYFDNIKIKEKINRGEAIKYYIKSIISEQNLSKACPRVFGSGKKLEIDEYIVISPTNSHINRSGINYRAWEKDKWIELIKKLDKNIVLVGSKGEEWYFDEFRPYPSNVIDLVGKLSIADLVSVIENAKYTICTDSAVGHISAAVNTEVFILMGPNDTITDSPYKCGNNKINIISLNLDCSPCYKTAKMKQCQNNICMKQISVDFVIKSLKRSD